MSPPEVGHYVVPPFLFGGRQVFPVFPRFPRPNHYLPPAIAQRHSCRCPRPSPQAPLHLARRLRRQRLLRPPRSLLPRLHPPRRPRRPLPPHTKVIDPAAILPLCNAVSPVLKIFYQRIAHLDSLYAFPSRTTKLIRFRYLARFRRPS